MAKKTLLLMKMSVFWMLLLGSLTLCHTAPAPAIASTISTDDQRKAEDYIYQFYSNVGVVNVSTRSLEHERNFTEELQSVQTFFGLEATGALNTETLEVMKTPRCGVSDISRFPGKPKWKKSLITYRITQYTPDLSQREVDATIAQAFQLYSDVIPLIFKQISSGNADIMITFKGRSLGGSYPFDGSGRVLAHANLDGRSQRGDAQFDDDETWTLTQNGVNLLLVAAHEFGHALGLDHSRDRRALMFPTYQYVNTNGYRLPDEDVRGVQALYGKRTADPQPKPPPTAAPRQNPEETQDPNPLPNPGADRCSPSLVFDAVTSIRGDFYFFKNGYYWLKSGASDVVLERVPSKWGSINQVDAAYEVPSKDTFFIIDGRQYWGVAYQSRNMIPGYPKPLTNLGLPSGISKVDAAVHVTITKKTLFFVNNQYWSYDEVKNQMDPGYPQDITQGLPGIGSKVDAVFEYYAYLYFSNGPKQSEYYLPLKKVSRVLMNYNWLNC